MKTFAFPALLLVAVEAQSTVSAWGQCGGESYSGGTQCVAGYTCIYENPWYSQCQPGSSPTSATSTVSTPTSSSSAPSGTGKLEWVGVNESGAEWGTAYPGTEGVDYFFPSTTTIGTLVNEGYNIFRVPFAMERMAVGSITASLNSAYLTPYSNVINFITSKGAYAIVDAHNYGRYNGQIITDTAGFQTFWNNLAKVYSSNSKVIFDINNEFNTMDESLVFELNQSGIDGIRAAGATSQYIFAEGNSWTGASTWNVTNDSLKTLSDSSNKLVYEMHQYLDSDSSGTGSDCVSNTVGVDRVEGATAWLRANGKKGMLGEFAGGNNNVCLAAVTGLLNHLQANSDVWLGASWWAAGPDWPAGTWASFEPPSGISYQYYDTLLKSYAP